MGVGKSKLPGDFGCFPLLTLENRVPVGRLQLGSHPLRSLRPISSARLRSCFAAMAQAARRQARLAASPPLVQAVKARKAFKVPSEEEEPLQTIAALGLPLRRLPISPLAVVSGPHSAGTSRIERDIFGRRHWWWKKDINPCFGILSFAHIDSTHSHIP